MQRLSRLTLGAHGRIRAATAWLAIVAVLGSMPLPAPARASCASRASTTARACALCHRAAPAATGCAVARPPCCGCEIGADARPAAPPAGLSLERPASQWQGAALSIALPSAFAPPRSAHGNACAPPGASPETPRSTTILRI
jgi:hypothetical protein